MKIYKYKNYDEYVTCQKEANARKSANVWAVEENIKFLADYVNKNIEAKNGLCHGTRGGYEQKWFNKYISGCLTIGSEIGDASAENTVQWDFNIQNPDWINKFDFIYSNSFDHAFNPMSTIRIWFEQIKSGGYIFLEYDKRQEHTGEISKSVNKTDPVSITVDELITLIPAWLDYKCKITVIDMPVVKKVYQKTVIIKKV